MSRQIPTVDLKLIEAIRIDWRKATQEGKDLMNKSFDLPWEEKIHNAEIAAEVLHQCSNADLCGYLELIEKYRHEIKGCPVTTY